MPRVTVTIPQYLMDMIDTTSSSPDDVIQSALKQYFDSRSTEKTQLTAKLLSIFGIVNDWVKFAEAKNGILLAFCGAAIPTVMNMLTSLGKASYWAYIMIIISLFCFFASTLICGWSFFPRTNFNNQKSKKSKSNPNLYFYEDLRNFNENELLDLIKKRYFHNNFNETDLSENNKEQLDLCNQVTVNSSIAMSKFNKFKTALIFLMAGISTAMISIVFKLLPYLSEFVKHLLSNISL
jgi:hypothetical protein